MAAIVAVPFATVILFHPSLIFVGKAGAYQGGTPYGLHSNGRLLALPANHANNANLSYCRTNSK